MRHADPQLVCRQVEGAKLRDYEGNYEEFLEKNEGEAVVMAAKEDKMREIEKDNIKAKSKMSKVCCRAAPMCIRQAAGGLTSGKLSSLQRHPVSRLH